MAEANEIARDQAATTSAPLIDRRALLWRFGSTAAMAGAAAWVAPEILTARASAAALTLSLPPGSVAGGGIGVDIQGNGSGGGTAGVGGDLNVPTPSGNLGVSGSSVAGMTGSVTGVSESASVGLSDAKKKEIAAAAGSGVAILGAGSWFLSRWTAKGASSAVKAGASGRDELAR